AFFYRNETQLSSQSYSADESTFSRIALHPLLPDPYESICCYVTKATVSDTAGEGLFARIDLPSRTVVSFYNGIKQFDRITERNNWELNSNAMSLDEEEHIDIDIPSPYDNMKYFIASLGHKANHSFDIENRNAMYD